MMMNIYKEQKCFSFLYYLFGLWGILDYIQALLLTLNSKITHEEFEKLYVVPGI